MSLPHSFYYCFVGNWHRWEIKQVTELSIMMFLRHHSGNTYNLGLLRTQTPPLVMFDLLTTTMCVMLILLYCSESVLNYYVYSECISHWTHMGQTVFEHIVLVLVNFNSNHSQWNYSSDNQNGTSLVNWADCFYLVCVAKNTKPFHSAFWYIG